MKVYLTYENKTQSIAQVLISAWEKIYLLNNQTQSHLHEQSLPCKSVILEEEL